MDNLLINIMFLSIIPALIARSKGNSFIFVYVISILMTPIIGLLVAAICPMNKEFTIKKINENMLKIKQLEREYSTNELKTRQLEREVERLLKEKTNM